MPRTGLTAAEIKKKACDATVVKMREEGFEKVRLTDIAKGSNVIVTRVLPDGTKKTFTVDVESIIRGKDSSAQAHSLLLEPGDIVYVPERII